MLLFTLNQFVRIIRYYIYVFVQNLLSKHPLSPVFVSPKRFIRRRQLVYSKNDVRAGVGEGGRGERLLCFFCFVSEKHLLFFNTSLHIITQYTNLHIITQYTNLHIITQYCTMSKEMYKKITMTNNLNVHKSCE